MVINASCTVDEAFAEAAKCTADTLGAALALYDDTIRQVYSLDPQDQAKGHLGDAVTVRGMLEGNAIHVASVQMFSEVGLRADRKAPDFSRVPNSAERKRSKRCEDPREPFSCFTARRIGAPIAKGN